MAGLGLIPGMAWIGEYMENASNQAIDEVQRIVDEQVEKLQKLVDDMKTVPQWASYVKMHKLASMDSKLADIDALLDSGILKD